jgi:ribosomal protein S18 acetylase RimI-like enzyme
MAEGIPVRQAHGDDLDAAAHLLHDFNVEFGEPTPGPSALARRLRQLVSDDTVVLVAGEPPIGVAALRFRPSIWSQSDECYLAELYVMPSRRGRGAGRALTQSAIEVARERGAASMEIGVDEPDAAARALYESLGFSNKTGAEGHVMYVYERDL